MNPATPFPAAPIPQIRQKSKNGPCRVVPRNESSGKALSATGAAFLLSLAGVTPAGEPAAGQEQTAASLPPCPPTAIVDFFSRFLNGPEVKPLTPKEKARLAAKNLMDPFNAVTILANAAIVVGSDPYSPYGPGMPGFARLVGVSYSEDTTSEFFGTFLIPSIFHQDPHYHREPQARIPRRILHAITQVGWTQGDNGKGLLNYANLIGFPIDAEIANLYVPGERTNLPSTGARVLTGLALSPTDNFITEFIPDLARRIHVRVVFVQEVINQVARTEP